MRNCIKKVGSLACLFIFLLSLTVYGNDSDSGGAQYNETQMKQTLVSLLAQIVEVDDSAAEEFNDLGKSIFNSWVEVRDDLGALKEKIDLKTVTSEEELNKILEKYDFKFEKKDTVLFGTITAEFEKGKADFTVKFTNDGTGQWTPVEGKFSVSGSGSGSRSMGVKLKDAVINTLIGLVTVFLVLIFISFLISLFKYIPRIADFFRKKPAVMSKEELEDFVPQIEEVTDNTELVAVISAAIAASEGQMDTDGFVVRTIRKSNTNKWKRA